MKNFKYVLFAIILVFSYGLIDLLYTQEFYRRGVIYGPDDKAYWARVVRDCVIIVALAYYILKKEKPK